jgi:hypothetical protein
LVSFFERAAAHDPQPPEPKLERSTPAWFEPLADVLPGQSDQRVVLFRTDRAILVLGQIDVYPTGIEFTIDLRLRSTSDDPFGTPWELHRPTRQQRPGGALPDEFLRLGFAFADGATWTNFDHNLGRFDEEPTVPVVIGRGGGGGGDRWTMRYWMWPLPPAGDLVVYAEWPLFGIDEVSAVINATELRHDAASAQLIWEAN